MTFRCAHYTQDCTDPVSMFLHYYSRYMAGEKKLVEDESDRSSKFCASISIIPVCMVVFIRPYYHLGETKLAHLKLLHQDLGRIRGTAKWDGYLCYLYGLVLRKLDLPHAYQVLQEAICLNPLNWAAWLELANLIKNSEMVSICLYHNHYMVIVVYHFLPTVEST